MRDDRSAITDEDRNRFLSRVAEVRPNPGALTEWHRHAAERVGPLHPETRAAIEAFVARRRARQTG